MNHLLDDEDDLHGRAEHRELTLSTSAVLAIFFGLAVLCALFLGFGYNLGRKSAQPSFVAASDAPSTPSATTTFNSFKPAAGSPATGTIPSTAIVPSTSTTSSGSPSPVTARPAPAVDGETTAAKPPALPQPSVPTETPAHPAATAAAAPAPATPANFIVQVAAVSHQEDADLLVGALKSKGYAVAARSEPQDKLVHIQVGPFSNRKDADAMRQRLLSDGYNAIVK
jgi:cell division septation protein DedD